MHIRLPRLQIFSAVLWRPGKRPILESEPGFNPPFMSHRPSNSFQFASKCILNSERKFKMHLLANWKLFDERCDMNGGLKPGSDSRMGRFPGRHRTAEKNCRGGRRICMARLLGAKLECSPAALLGQAKIRVLKLRAFGVILRTITFTFV